MSETLGSPMKNPYPRPPGGLSALPDGTGGVTPVECVIVRRAAMRQGYEGAHVRTASESTWQTSTDSTTFPKPDYKVRHHVEGICLRLALGLRVRKPRDPKPPQEQTSRRVRRRVHHLADAVHGHHPKRHGPRRLRAKSLSTRPASRRLDPSPKHLASGPSAVNTTPDTLPSRPETGENTTASVRFSRVSPPQQHRRSARKHLLRIVIRVFIWSPADVVQWQNISFPS